MVVLEEIHTTLNARGIRLTVILLPYEYQLRENREPLFKPQRLVSRRLKDKDIPLVDLSAGLAAAGDSKSLFLHADPMHLSVAGHLAVFAALQDAGALKNMR